MTLVVSPMTSGSITQMLRKYVYNIIVRLLSMSLYSLYDSDSHSLQLVSFSLDAVYFGHRVVHSLLIMVPFN